MDDDINKEEISPNEESPLFSDTAMEDSLDLEGDVDDLPI